MEREYLLSDLFEISTTKSIDKNKLELKPTGKYDFIGRTSVNNGIQGNIDKLEYEANPKNTFSLVQIGESIALWREREWYASQNIFILKPKMPEINDTFLYFQTLINKQMSKYGNAYNSYPTMKSLLVTKISVPVTKEDQIDWNYMKDYIAELEEERIAELEQYLIATGLNDYQLTEEDINTLSLSQKRNNKESDCKDANWISEKMKFFRCGDLFKIHPTKAYKMSNEELYKTKGSSPVLSNSSSNNGIAGYCGLTTIEDGNIITFSDTTTGADTMFYQPSPFIGYPHVQGMYPNDKNNWKEYQQRYFICAMKCVCGNGWSYSNKFNRKLVAEMQPLLPIKVDKNGNPVIDNERKYHKNGYIPDWDYMEKYIRVIEKIVIADVVKYKDDQIYRTKRLIRNYCT